MSEELMKKSLLDSIHGVEDLRRLRDEDMPDLAKEIRCRLVDTVTKTGGHLASNLGIVEITLAIHRVFNTPYDHLIFDVGHQSYVHKMVTGRKDQFETLRTPGGLSGFTKRKESPFDAYGAGHSSTSIAAGIGFASADVLKGDKKHTIVVIGDGALTGGLALEALNNCKPDLPLIIIYNENYLSISKNVGSFSTLLSKIRISKNYRKAKRATKKWLPSFPCMNKAILSIWYGMKRKLKNHFYPNNIFEDLGLQYLGPFDGHDYSIVKMALEDAKEKNACVVVHFKTTKGKGYPPAEKAPADYHAIAPTGGNRSFHHVIDEELSHLGELDDSIVAVTPATGYTTGLVSFEKNFPKRFFDCGIAEDYAVTFSCGLACEGLKPYCVIYSSFLQRAYDQILHDVVIQKLPVRFLIDRAGLSLGDGATHHGIYDVSFLLSFKKIPIYHPLTYASLTHMLQESRDVDGPVAIRYSNSSESEDLVNVLKKANMPTPYIYVIGDLEHADIVLLSYGREALQCMIAANSCTAQGKQVACVFVECLYQPEEELLNQLLKVQKDSILIFAEEGIHQGGFSQLVESLLLSKRPDLKTAVVAIEDGTVELQQGVEPLDTFGISSTCILHKIQLMGDFCEN